MILRAANFFKKYRFVVLVLFVSSLLRWILILRGGQFYFPDENRYGIAQDTLALLLEGKVRTALLTLVDELAHVGFKITALIPALVEKVFGAPPAFAAIFFSFFSILSLLMIWLIARKAGASARMANYALFLAACSQVLLYYSRHLFPYDQAMFFGLLALYIALGTPNTPGVSFWTGIVSFLCLVTYNGYWPMAAFPMIVGVLNGEKEDLWILKRPLFIGLGFFTPLAALLLACIVIGKDFFSDYGVYLQKIVQGSFSEGWSLPFEYFWHAEQGFFIVVGLLTTFAMFLFLKDRNKYLYLALGGAFFVYLCLAIPSNVTHTFVVYARTARQLMPFLVMTAACGLSLVQSWKTGGRWLVHLTIAFVFIQAVWNYQSVYKIIYPREFLQKAQQEYPEFEVSAKMVRFYAPLVCKSNGLIAKNFHYIYTWPQPVPVIPGEVLMSASHPLNFPPHQYDGFTREERQTIRKEYFEMVLYRPDENYLASVKNEIERCNQAK